MWRYFENVDNPKKRKRSDEERAAAKKVYEEKRKRKWQDFDDVLNSASDLYILQS